MWRGDVYWESSRAQSPQLRTILSTLLTLASISLVLLPYGLQPWRTHRHHRQQPSIHQRPSLFYRPHLRTNLHPLTHHSAGSVQDGRADDGEPFKAGSLQIPLNTCRYPQGALKGTLTTKGYRHFQEERARTMRRQSTLLFSARGCLQAG